MSETKPCGSKQCLEWIRSSGYEPDDHPDSVCLNCGFSGPIYAWLTLSQDKRRNKEPLPFGSKGKDVTNGQVH